MSRHSAFLRGKAESHGDFGYILNPDVQLRRSPMRSPFDQSGLPLTYRLQVSLLSLEIALMGQPLCMLRQEPLPVFKNQAAGGSGR